MRVSARWCRGTYNVNGAGQAPHSPFGGFKQSGIGREMGPEGLAMYTETKATGIPTERDLSVCRFN